MSPSVSEHLRLSPRIATPASIVAVLVVLFALVAALSIVYFGRTLHNTVRQQVESELVLLEKIVLEELLRRRYLSVETTLLEWARHSGSVAALLAEAPNGFIVADFRAGQGDGPSGDRSGSGDGSGGGDRSGDRSGGSGLIRSLAAHGTDHARLLTRSIRHQGDVLLTLRVLQDLTPVQERLASFQWLLAATFPLLAALLGWFLWMVVRHTAINPMERAEAALLAQQGHLETLVRQRTQDLEFEVNERRAAEEATRQSELRLRAIIDSLDSHVVVLDDKGRISHVNAAWVRFGNNNGAGPRTAADWRGLDYFVCGDDDTGREVVAALQEILAGTRAGYAVEYPCHSPSTDRWFLLSAQPLHEGTGLVISHLEVTERKQAEFAIEEQRSYLNAILEFSMDQAIVTADNDMRIVYYNPAAEAVFGIPVVEALGRNVLDIHRDHAVAEEAYRNGRQALEKHGRHSFITSRYRGQKNRVYETQITPIRDTSQQQLGFLFLSIDITERQAYERRIERLNQELEQRVAARTEELQLSLKRLSTLAALAPVGVFQTDSQGHCLYANERWLSIAGLTLEEARGPGWGRALHPDDRERVFGLWYEAATHCLPFHAEYRFQTPDGTDTWLIGQATPELGTDGQVVGYVGTITDISEKKLEEHSREVITRLLQLALTVAPIDRLLQDALALVLSSDYFSVQHKGAVFLYDARTEMLHLTAAIGLEPQIVQMCRRIEPGQYSCGLDAATGRVVRDVPGAPVDEPLGNRFEDMGEQGHYALPILADEIRLGVLVVYLADGQDRNSGFETYLQLAVHALAGLIQRQKLDQHLVDAKESAEKANRAKSDFLANMSHEIRTPLNAVIGLGQLMMDTRLSVRQFDYLTKINASAKGLLSLINDILDYSKIESGHLELEATEFTLESVLEQLITVLSVQAEEKGLELLLDISDGLGDTLVGDPFRLTQILLNLGSNAIKFTEQGEVLIGIDIESVRPEGLTLLFSVCDTGIGISDTQRDLLFRSFTQADTSTTRRFGGTGLGLAICRRLVTLMGGAIWVESQPGQGSAFQFSLPVGRGDIAGMPKKRSETDALSGDRERVADLAGCRVLVVDDNRTSRMVLCRTLASFGLETEQAVSGTEAIERIQASKRDGRPFFDMVFMDWRMPEMEGLTTLRHLRGALPDKHGVPVLCIMVSAFGREEVREHIRAGWADAFLSKPVTPDLLRRAVLQSLGSPPSGSPPSGSPPSGSHSSHGSDLDRVQVPPRDEAWQKRSEWSMDLARFRGARVLVAEDNPINRQVIVEFLQGANISVDTAVHGADAVDRVLAEDAPVYDAILMDIQMPVMDGFMATRTLLERSPDLTTPIIAMTANVMKSDVDACLAAGMVEHVAKPLDIRRLYSVLDRFIGKKEGGKKEGLPPDGRPADVGSLSGAVGDALAGEPGTGVAPRRLPARADGLDIDQGLARLNGKETLYLELLAAFSAEFGGSAETLAAQIRTHAFEEAGHRAHAIKGTAGNLGAAALERAASDLEKMLRDPAGREDGPALLSAFETALKEVLDSIPRLLPASARAGRTEPSCDQPAPLLEPSDRQALLELRNLLDNNNLKAGARFQSLRTTLERAGLATTAQKLSEHIARLEFPEAVDKINRILES